MTTEVYTHDISVYEGFKLVGAVATNLYFQNTGSATLNATLFISLHQHVGTDKESINNLQCWVRNDIAPNDNIEFSGTYFLTDPNLELILTEINGDSQTLRLRLEVTGSEIEADRLALTKQNYTGVIDCSRCAAKY